jgi:RHS repeat-associated protein
VWPGQQADEETGLHYNRHRYYDPELGTYLSQDPIRLLGGTAFYAYADDPTTQIDPFGLVPAPASLPDSPGVYTLTNNATNESYVGSAGYGDAGMNSRVSTASHGNAQHLLAMEGTTVHYRRVDLGTATSRSDRNNILRHFENIERNRQAAAGYHMLNDAPIQAAAKRAHAEQLIEQHGVTAGRRVKCR